KKWHPAMSGCHSFKTSKFLSSRSFRRRDRDAGDLHPHRSEGRARGEEQGLPVVASERQVGRLRLSVDDTAKLVALRIHDVDAARPPAIDVAGRIHFHAVRSTRLGAGKLDKDAFGLLRQ